MTIKKSADVDADMDITVQESEGSAAGTTEAELLGCKLFRDLAQHDLARLRGKFRQVCFAPRTPLATRGQPADALYVILSGYAKLSVDRGGHMPLGLGLLGAGQVFGENCASLEAIHYVHVVAHEPCVCLWLHRDAWRSHLEAMPDLSGNLIEVMAQRLQWMAAKVEMLRADDVKASVALQLLAFADEHGQRRNSGIYIPFRLTQGDLAEFIGASRAHVNKAINRLRVPGCISLDHRHHITIHDRRALEAQAR